jgi:hypothetical protein
VQHLVHSASTATSETKNMFETIPSHGVPEGVVFGIVGEIFESDNGFAYIKEEDDEKNVGWVVLTTDI